MGKKRSKTHDTIIITTDRTSTTGLATHPSQPYNRFSRIRLTIAPSASSSGPPSTTSATRRWRWRCRRWRRLPRSRRPSRRRFHQAPLLLGKLRIKRHLLPRALTNVAPVTLTMAQNAPVGGVVVQDLLSLLLSLPLVSCAGALGLLDDLADRGGCSGAVTAVVAFAAGG